MIRSMTGFGRGVAERDSSRMTVELKSVNSRYLETNVRMPRVILTLENDVKNRIAQSVSRGKMDVFINYEPGEGQKTVTVSEDLGAYVAALREAGERYGLEDDLKISHILRIPDMLQTQQKDTDPKDVWPLLEEALAAALEQLNSMREREGSRIREDLLGKASEIERIVMALQASAPEIEDAYREKLTKRIQEILSRNGGVPVDKGLLENEIAFYADHNRTAAAAARRGGACGTSARFPAAGVQPGGQYDRFKGRQSFCNAGSAEPEERDREGQRTDPESGITGSGESDGLD